MKRSSSLVVLWNWTLGSAWLPLCRVVPHPRRRPHSICLRCPRPDSIPGGAGARPDHPISRCSSCERQDLTGIFFDREKPPPAWDALEDVRTSIRAFHSRSGDQILHGAGEKNLSGLSAGCYTGTDVHSNASHLVAFNYALTSVNTAADRQSQSANHVPDRAGAFNRARWTVKGCEDTIARGVHYPAAEPRDFLANLLMIVVDQVAPARVSNRRGALSRLDNVDEEDGCENTVRL